MEGEGHPQPARDYVLAAVEAGAGALRALEASVLDTESEIPADRREHIMRAIELLREAISEMRSSQL